MFFINICVCVFFNFFLSDMSQRPTHSQPDLLCAQNTFPRHLDSPPSVHDRLAADGSVPGGGSVVNHFEANLLPDIGQVI